MLPQFGRVLILFGLAMVGLGVVLLLIGRFNLPLGRLPGDIIYRGKHATVYFPWVTVLLISLLLTLILRLFTRR